MKKKKAIQLMQSKSPSPDFDWILYGFLDSKFLLVSEAEYYYRTRLILRELVT